MALAAHITAVCRVYAGTVKRGKLVNERCGQCPLRVPCLKFGGAPARTFDELVEARETFATEATAILAEKE